MAEKLDSCTLAILPAELLSGSKGGGNYEFGVRSIFVHCSKSFLLAVKFLRNGADSFTSPPIEGMMRIFIALKNPSPSPSLNQRTLGPMASTLTIIPPRLLRIYFLNGLLKLMKHCTCPVEILKFWKENYLYFI
jgi:hypothetical protein